MLIAAEISTNPGPNTLFVAELRIESCQIHNSRHAWWGLWLAWWLYKPREWRDWLYGWEYSNGEKWHTVLIRVCGFEINLQLRRKDCYG